jgi:hypothetical protein
MCGIWSGGYLRHINKSHPARAPLDVTSHLHCSLTSHLHYTLSLVVAQRRSVTMSVEPDTGSAVDPTDAADPLDLESLDADSLFAALTAVERVSRVVPLHFCAVPLHLTYHLTLCPRPYHPQIQKCGLSLRYRSVEMEIHDPEGIRDEILAAGLQPAVFRSASLCFAPFRSVPPLGVALTHVPGRAGPPTPRQTRALPPLRPRDVSRRSERRDTAIHGSPRCEWRVWGIIMLSGKRCSTPERPGWREREPGGGLGGGGG